MCQNVQNLYPMTVRALINPNQLRAYGIDVNDDPFDSSCNFGIESEQVLIPFNTMGTVVLIDVVQGLFWTRSL
jgi:hypothetical protein